MPTPAATPTPSPVATAAPSATALASPSATPTGFVFQGSAPVVTTALIDSGEAFVNPGAVIVDHGTFHMFANSFTAWPGKVSVYHLTSDDGVSWTPASADPILTSDDVPYARPGADVSSGFVDQSGTWVLLIESVNTVGPWQIGRATAPGPDGPWTVEAAPVLTEGAAGSWDAGGTAWPSVVQTSNGWSVYYAGRSAQAGATSAIGLATSTDGELWTKRPDPVLTASADWELGSLDRPRVAVTSDGIAMVYAGKQLTDRGLALSADGVSWQRQGDAPAITRDDFPVTGQCWDGTLVSANGSLTYYLEIGGGTPSTGTAIFRATALYASTSS